MAVAVDKPLKAQMQGVLNQNVIPSNASIDNKKALPDLVQVSLPRMFKQGNFLTKFCQCLWLNIPTIPDKLIGTLGLNENIPNV